MAYSPKEIKKAKELIINKIATGSSLKKILEDNEIPSRNRVYEWLNELHDKFDREFRDNYARAREESADLDADVLQEIAEKTLNGTYDPAAARVASSNYMWAAAKKQPKKYGDKLDMSIEVDKIKPIITKRDE